MIPLIAIVGRPNVGKSTLFNRLVRARQAIVQNDPGVTRDRHYGTASFENRTFTIVDTGGFEPDAKTGIDVLVREQARLAIEESDLVLAVFDARDGVMEIDKAVVQGLRREGKPVLYIANKVDGPNQNALAAEFFSMGLPEVFNISAEHGLGFEELLDGILAALPDGEENSDPEEEQKIQVALVGRPNAGKSSLLNCLVGSQRAIVSDVPGTTRDPVDARVQTSQGTYVLVDTAGIRRRKSASPLMEKFSIIRALRCITNADIACLIIDAHAGVAEQDARIVGMALEAGKGLILVFTKMDLLPTSPKTRRTLKEQVAEKLQFIPYAPLLFVSGTTGQGTRGILPKVRRIHTEGGKRVSTSKLNRFLEQVTAAHAPPAYHGRQVKLYYMTQPQSHPPTFIVSTNHSNGVHITYRRYIANRLRENFGFEGTPLRLFFRQRSRTAKPKRR